MSSKYNRFLLSTCLPVMAVALCMPISVQAGFEWTPPEEIETISFPVDDLEPVQAEAVVSEILTDIDEIIYEDTLNENDIFEEPNTQIKVIDDNGSSDAKEIIEEIVIVETQIIEEDQIENVAFDEEIIIVEPEAIELETPYLIEEIGEEVIIETSGVDTLEDPAPLKIDLFPIHDGEENNRVEEAPIILTSDINDDVEEVMVEEAVEVVKIPDDKIIWNKAEAFDVIEGFGTDMPLALALRQIVPAQYAFSFGKDVNAGASISWNGGKPWNDVLQDSLTPLDISYEIKGKKLILNKVVIEEIDSTNLDLQQEEPIQEDPAAIAEEIPVDEILQEEAFNADDVNIVEVELKLADNSPINIIEIEENVDADIVEDTSELALDAPTIEEVMQDDAPVKRNIVSDPGQFESSQPEMFPMSEESDLLEGKSDIDLSNVEIDEPVVITWNAINGEISPELDTFPINNEEALSTESSDEDIVVAIQKDEEVKSITIENIAPVIVKEIDPSFQTEPSNTIKIWEAKRHSNLEKIVKNWSEEENIKLTWNETNDYKIDKDVFISGTFKNALNILFSKGLRNPPKYSLTEKPYYELNVGE